MSATDVAFAMVGTTQGVVAVVWLLGSWLLGDTRRAALHWSGFAAFSALSFALLTMALHAPTVVHAEVLRAGGNLALLGSLIALQRGVWLFVARPVGPRLHLAVIAIALVVSWIGLRPEGASLRIGVMSAVLSVLTLGVAVDLHAYGRDVLRMRWAWLMTVPAGLATLAYASRGIRAIVAPASIPAEMTADSVLNVGSALSYLVIVLSVHATLIALVVGRLLADLRHRSRHDGLTGLLDRRAIEEAVEAQIRRSRRSGEVFAVLMLDIDHFKSINDRFGHSAGDQALKQIAALLRAGVREIDSIARIGGEEFLALMPGASGEVAKAVAERLREQLAAHPLQFGADAVALTVSIGMARWTDKAEDASRLLVRADAALYMAKQQGRDRVVAAGAGAVMPAWDAGRL